MQPQIQRHDYKVTSQSSNCGLRWFGTHVDTFMPEHGVLNGQSVTSTEVQQENAARVQIRGAIRPDQAPPGLTVATNVSIEVTQKDEEILRRSTLQYPL